MILLILTQDALGSTGILNPGVKWRFKTLGAVRSQPLIVNDVIIFGSTDGRLYAVEKRSGSLKWSISTNSPITSSPISQGPLVYFISDDQQVYAADLASGDIKWTFRMNAIKPSYWEWDYFTASPVYADGVLWVGSGDGNLYCLDALSGKQRWKYETTGRIRAAPAVTEKIVYVPSNDGIVYALDKTAGKLIWKFGTDGAAYDSRKSGWDRNSIYAPLIATDSVLIVASRDGKTYAVDVNTRKERWSVTYGPTWAMSTSLKAGTVYIGWSDNSLLSAIDLKTGKERWKFKAGSMVYTKPLVTDSEVLVGSADEKVYCLNAVDGTKRWEYKVGAAVYSSPVVDEGVVFVGSDDGNLYALHEKLKPVKAVFQPITNDAGMNQAFLADPKITPFLKDHGFLHLDSVSIDGFIKQRIADKLPSVIVFAYEQLPSALIGTHPENGLLRQYLNSGGKVVWFGNIPALYTIDKNGKPSMDITRGERMLGVKFSRPEESGNYYSKTTQAGINLGLPEWKMFTYANVENIGITPLAVDGFGRTTAWMKAYNDQPGSGFFSCRTWGWYSPIHDEDLRIVLEMANYELE
ncbi:PQQ-binding-like beta-propeller repeat protein [Chryseolinea sp. T2]|uniref:outer membrane protein assembly factor BamB family protein n=1 Tax=Chryseolinea sp. T2 TaxID=3129255 RepID=UPI003077A9C6